MSAIELNLWQCNKSFTESMDYMRSNNICCDVTFIVGTTGDKIRAHKLVMIARSPVFYSMFEGPLAETNVISVPDIEKDVFELFLKYLYTDRIDIDEHVAASLLYTAHKYMVDELTKYCISYYMNIMTTENACTLLEQACFYDIPKLRKTCLRYICQNADECLNSEAFTSLGHQSVDVIAKCEDLYLEEYKIYEALIRWSDAECLRKTLELSDLSRRDVLGDILYNIHFPAIQQEYFEKKIVEHNVLSNEEKKWIKSNQEMSKKDREVSLFKDSDRTFRPQKYENAMRLKNLISHNWCPSGSVEAIVFKISHPVWFHGVVLYGKFVSKEESSVTAVHIQVTNGDDDVVASVQNCKIVEIDDNLNSVLLDLPIQLDSEESYVLQVNMEGKFVSWGGSNGQATIQFYNTEITFDTCLFPKTETDINEGQIPGLLLSAV